MKDLTGFALYYTDCNLRTQTERDVWGLLLFTGHNLSVWRNPCTNTLIIRQKGHTRKMLGIGKRRLNETS